MEIEKMEVCELLKLGDTLIEENKIDEAAAVYSQSISLDPSYFWSHYHLASISLEQGKVNEAIASYQRAIEIDPSFHWSYHHLGNAFAQQQRWQEAAVAFQQAIALHSEHYGTYHGLGQSLQKLGNFDEAIVAFQKGIELNQDSDWLKSDLIGAIEQKLELNNQLLVNTYYSLAQSLVKQGKQEEAISCWLIILQQFSNILEPETLRQVASNIIGEQLADDDRIKIYGKISKIFVHKGQLEQAITMLCSAVLLNSNCQELYHILGEIISQKTGLQSELDQFRIDLDETKTKLLELQAELTKSEDIKTALNETQTQLLQLQAELTISKNIAKKSISYYQWAVESHPEELLSKEEWEQATNTLRDALEIAPESGYNAYVLGLALTRIGQEEEALAVFHRAVELLEQQAKVELTILSYQEMLKLSSNGDIFFKLGMLLAQCGRFAEGLTAYELALQSLSGKPEDYAKLAVILVQQGFREDVINSYHQVFQHQPESAKHYHNLGIILSQQGLIDAAVTCFSAAQRKPSEAEIYETIWKSLNGLGSINENDPLYQIEIQPEVAEAYFSQTSQYRVIPMWSWTEEDKEFLSGAGLSIEYLELMGRSDPAIEQIYVNSFPNDKPINFFTEEETGISTKRDDHYFQQSIAETGYFHIICPHSGRVLRSNQSFSMHCQPGYHRYQINIYRFVGTEVFYLMCSAYFWQKSFIYFPKMDTIIILRPDVSKLYDYVVFNQLKAYAVSCWRDFKSYIYSQKSKKSAILLGVLANIAHYFWIDMGGCEFLSQTGRLENMKYFITGTWEYLKIADLFPEISSERIIPFPDKCDNFMIFQMLLKENYFVFTPSDFILTEKFVQQRIYPACVKKCSESFLQICEEAKTHFPLFLIQIRSQTRSWLSQIEGSANIIKKLYLDYPNLAVVFDGWTRVDGVENPDEEAQIQRDQVVVDNIISLIPSTIPVYSTVGSTISETIMFTKAIDLYIGVIGAGNTFEWIWNKPGVVYQNTAMHQVNIMSSFIFLRENAIVPAIVSIEHIYNEINPGDWNTNFDYDWQVIYDEVLKQLQSIEVKKQATQTMQENNEDQVSGGACRPLN